MKSGVVEGEPGIFPDPIARLLRAIGRFVTTRRGRSAEPEDVDVDEKPQDRTDQPLPPHRVAGDSGCRRPLHDEPLAPDAQQASFR
jgi:hypothetical protein